MAEIRRPTPREVLHAMLGKLFPELEVVAEKINEEWIRGANPLTKAGKISQVAQIIINAVTSAVRDGDLPLYDKYGELIPFVDCQRGILHWFDGTLTIESDSLNRVYEDVSCHLGLAERLIDSVLLQMQTASVESRERPRADPVPAPAAEHKYRYACDAALVEEGRRLVAGGMNRSQAARAIAPKAKSGPGEPDRSLQQHTERLRKLL
jgi:hypothetical protein